MAQQRSGQITCNFNTKRLSTKVILKIAIPENIRGAFRTPSNIYDGVFLQKCSIYPRCLSGI